MSGCDEFTAGDHSESIEALLAELRLQVEDCFARFDFSRH